jgi:peptide subunit release factor 1 (eRF1)
MTTRERVLELMQEKGNCTELVTLYVPMNADIGSIQKTLNHELGTASHIKDPHNSRAVSGAIRQCV